MCVCVCLSSSIVAVSHLNMVVKCNEYTTNSWQPSTKPGKEVPRQKKDKKILMKNVDLDRDITVVVWPFGQGSILKYR